jgi:hypothetical protein
MRSKLLPGVLASIGLAAVALLADGSPLPLSLVDEMRGGVRLAADSPVATTPAPAAVVQELQTALGLARGRFEAQDVPGFLAHVSDQYRTGPFTKAGLREQFVALNGLYDALRANVRIDDVQMVGDHAWVYSTGQLSGRLRFVGAWVVFLSWQRELEVARREGGRWRLYGYQQ